MNWFVWRQHRKQFLIFGILLAAFAALVIPTGLHFWHAYQQALASCAQNPAVPSCGDLPGSLFQSNTDQILFHLLPLAVVLLPLVLGMFWGAPLIAREYTEGTNSLAWTQSISRRRWLTAKLVWVLAATAILTGAFAALITWWSKTPNALNMDRFGNGILFDAQGVVPVAYGLFAVAVGTMLGAWFRKVMVAVGITLGLFIALVVIAVPNFVRPHYMTPITVTAPMGPDILAAKIPAGSWIISQNILDKNGHVFTRLDFPNMPPQCQQLIQQAQTGVVIRGGRHVKAAPAGVDAIDSCLDKAGFHQVATYQPGYRYWDFQRIEAAIYLGLAAVAVGATYWLVLKRDA